MKNMIPGKKYKVKLEDCCVDGSFEGVFKGYLDYSDNENGTIIESIPDHDHFDAVFDIGHIGPGWGNWNAELID